MMFRRRKTCGCPTSEQLIEETKRALAPSLARRDVEISKLRAQVAELLPWAEAGVNDRLDVSIGDAYWPARELRARIDAGEFGGAS